MRVHRDDGAIDVLTFAGWDAASDGLARQLVEIGGLQRGDRVMLHLPAAEARTFAIAYFAVHKAGGIVVPVNPRYAHREVQHIIASCEPALIVSDEIPLVAGDDVAAPLQVPLDGSDVADILYTSGTT